MKDKMKEMVRFFTFFYVIGVFLFTTFNLSFYIYDFLFLLSNWRKLLFILIYTLFLSIYFTIYIVFQIKRGRLPAFVSGLCAIHYLQEYQRSIGWSNFHYLFDDIRPLIELLVVTAAFTSIIVSDLIQIYHMRLHFEGIRENERFAS